MSRYVLTIQSHVAYGFVGNSAAVFPLQLLGFSPIVVNTVEFSNHTGHPTFRGQVFTAELIRDIILGIRERGLMPKIEGLGLGHRNQSRQPRCYLAVRPGDGRHGYWRFCAS